MSLTRFIFAVHCHQPVGNFPWVLEEAYALAYHPFLEAVERHPGIRVVFHYSGNLLDWFEERHPEFLKRLATLVRRGQAELLGGGHYEPIFPLIPEKDALGQLRMMDQAMIRLKLAPREGLHGAWLSERAWEPQVASLFARAGVRYTVVDDHHLALAGIPEEERFGYYLTEDRGSSIALFPSSKRLRYLVPFKTVEEVMATLRELSSQRSQVVVLADDGEKFGLWPGTNRWVYEQGWLENFFQQIERSQEWLKCMTFRESVETLPPMGWVNLPCSSYEEMNEWSGGSFRNFLIKYPEVETLQRKMLWISWRLQQMQGRAVLRPKTKTLLSKARRHLYMSQSNDAYWHGIFGGLYLRHLRRSLYQNLLRAEQLLDEAETFARVDAQWRGMETPWRAELLVRSKQLTLLFDLHRGGQLLELSDKVAGLNLLDTLSRRPEAYHQRLKMENDSGHHSHPGSGNPSTIHGQEETLRPELRGLLVYDSYRRAGLIDHFFASESDPHPFAQGKLEELGDFGEDPYQARVEKRKGSVRAILTRTGSVKSAGIRHSVNVTKKVDVNPSDRRLIVSYRLLNLGNRPLTILFGSELNLALKDAHVNRIGQADGIRRFALVDPAERLQIQWAFTREARLWHFPIETVSGSERGMERTYQGVSLTFLWLLHIAPRMSWNVHWTMGVESVDEERIEIPTRKSRPVKGQRKGRVRRRAVAVQV